MRLRQQTKSCRNFSFTYVVFIAFNGDVEHISFRLDLILGKTGSKKVDAYDSKISVSSRIVKVERQVITLKLNGLKRKNLVKTVIKNGESENKLME